MSDEAKCPDCGRGPPPIPPHRPAHGVTYCWARIAGSDDGDHFDCLRLTVERMRPVVDAARKLSAAMHAWDRSLMPYGPGRSPNGAEDHAFDCWRICLSPALDALDGKAGTP